MQYLHIKNLEKYHPGYQDRSLIWCKTYFTMLNADPEFEMLCETDKWRFIAFVMLELQIKKPVPLDPDYLRRKGFDLKKRSMSLTLQMLHTLVEVRNAGVTQSRVDKSRVDICSFSFEDIWSKYPKKVGKKKAQVHFKASVKTDKDWQDINTALKNYLESERVMKGYIQNASTWFNNWRDWVDYKEPVCPICKNTGKFRSVTPRGSFENICKCPAGENFK